MVSPDNIFAVGGGKGGTGKSVIATNLAAGLALSGRKTVLMDADIGASNTHALLGIHRPCSGLRDWFLAEGADPSSLFLDTGIGNLKLVSAAGDPPGSADLCDTDFEKAAKLIESFEADCVVLDLGPGTQHRTVDLFNLSANGIVVTTPEITSIMKTFAFIRAALFRKIRRAFADRPEIVRWVDHSHPGDSTPETPSMDVLRENIRIADPEFLEALESVVNRFSPLLVVNRVREKRDLEAGDQLIRLVKKHLDVDVAFLGFVVESECVRDSVDARIPFLLKEPQSKPSLDVQKIIGDLIQTEIQFVKKDGQIFILRQEPLTPKGEDE